MENTSDRTSLQKRKGYVSDHELIGLAQEAVQQIFSSDVIASSSIEVRYSVKAPADIIDDDDDKNISIWFVHHTTDDNFKAGDIARASIKLWELMDERGDYRRPSMYHGYESDPRAAKQAA
jgi:hypothetical protein